VESAIEQTELVTELKLSDSISVAMAPDELYGLVSDVTRMGEWSPICRACWWDEGDGPRVGASFTGRNELPERTWETRCRVVAADPGREFAWVVNDGWVRWGYTFEPENGGTRLTESWEFLPAGIAGFQERFGAEADAQIEQRHAAAESGIPATLAAIKKAAEAR
jgi:Polyketide cyclase / dehydrase and lipid transport